MDIKENIDLLNKCYSAYIIKKEIYPSMYRYAIEGQSDARINYKNN